MGKRRGGGGGGGRERGGGGLFGGGGDDDFGGGGGRQDQYGGFGSQDRDQHQGFSGGRGGRGGGTAGSTRKPGGDFSFQRHVPKFLQQYAHLLPKGHKPPSEDEPLVVKQFGGGDRGDDEDDEAFNAEGGIEAEALKRAMAENPELAKEFEATLQERLNQAMAVEEKEKGNKAFGEKKYDQAIKHFNKCIELDPKNEVYYSNRSAAYASLEKYEEAKQDALKAVSLKPSWAKAHSRLGAAYFGLKLYSEAKEAYEKALKIEPDDQAVQKGFERAYAMELQQMRDNKHTFKKARIAPAAEGKQAPYSGAGPAIKNKTLLSFGEDEEQE